MKGTQTIPSVALFLLLSVSHAVELPDSIVGTLQLDAELPARGQLGGVTVDRLGFIYVSNFRDSVWKISPEGEVKLLTDSLYGSSGNAIDAQGNLYQANFIANTITRIDRAGELSIHLEEGLSGPVGLAFDAEGSLYICNCQDNTISKFSSDGELSTFSSGPLFACPNGITVSLDGSVYVVNYNNETVVHIDESGNAAAFAEIPVGGNAHIALMQERFYVTKLNTNQVFEVSFEGAVRLVAGTGEIGLIDGPALSSTLARPNGIAASLSGDILYINNLDTWGGTEIGNMTVRTLEIVTLSKVLEAALADGGIDEAKQIYDAYKSDPESATIDTEQDISRLASRLLRSGAWREALPIFEWNAASYPESWAAQDNLGFSNSVTGNTERAIEAYQRSLEINPNNENAKSQLLQLDVN